MASDTPVPTANNAHAKVHDTAPKFAVSDTFMQHVQASRDANASIISELMNYILSHDHSRDVPGKETSSAGRNPQKDGGDNGWLAFILSHDHSRDVPKAAPAK